MWEIMRSVLTKDDKEILNLRNINTSETTDDYTSQIAKNIPIEVVSFYTGIFALITANANDPAVTSLSGLMFIIALLGTILYSWLKNTRDKVPNVEIKAGMATIAFIIWAYTIWWPFGTYIPQNALIGGALVLTYLFASPGVYELITTIQIKTKTRRGHQKIAQPESKKESI
jgi:hypothetical protein